MACGHQMASHWIAHVSQTNKCCSGHLVTLVSGLAFGEPGNYGAHVVSSKAETVAEYLDDLEPDRREAISAVREVIVDHLGDGFVEEMRWGMICYEVPLDIEPDTYNGKPLMYAALASQKRHMAVYLSGIYGDDELRERFEADYEATGKRMDIGKSCVRFRKLDDLPVELIGAAIGEFSVDEFCALVDKARG